MALRILSEYWCDTQKTDYDGDGVEQGSNLCTQHSEIGAGLRSIEFLGF